MINTIIFDLAEVYLNGIIGVEKYLEPVLGLKNHSEVHAALEGDKFREFMHGKINEDEYWRRAINENKWSLSAGELKSLIRKNFQEIPGTRSIIESLKEKGYKLGLLSVHAREWIEYCESKFDYHKLFDAISYSYEEGFSKPDKRTYEMILKKLNSNPKESLFIDDSEKNITAAKEIGLEVIRFESVEQLRKELKNIGVKI